MSKLPSRTGGHPALQGTGPKPWSSSGRTETQNLSQSRRDLEDLRSGAAWPARWMEIRGLSLHGGGSAASSLSSTFPLALALAFALSLASFAFTLPFLFACSFFLLWSSFDLDGSSVYLLGKHQLVFSRMFETQTVSEISETTELHSRVLALHSLDGGFHLFR